MSAIQKIASAYAKLQDKEALLSLKAQREKLLALTDEANPFFAKLRDQCLEELAILDAELCKLHLAGLPDDFEGPLPSSVPFVTAGSSGHSLGGEKFDEERLDSDFSFSVVNRLGQLSGKTFPSFMPNSMHANPPDLFIDLTKNLAWKKRDNEIVSSTSLLSISRASHAWQSDTIGNWSRANPHVAAVSNRGIAIWENSVNLVWFSDSPSSENGWALENNSITLQPGMGPGADLNAYLYDDGAAEMTSHRLTPPSNMSLTTA